MLAQSCDMRSGLGEGLAEGPHVRVDLHHGRCRGLAEVGHVRRTGEVEGVGQGHRLALEQGEVAEVADPVDVLTGDLGVEDQVVGVASIVVVSRGHEDGHPQLLHNRPVRARRPTEDEVAQEAGVAQALRIVVSLVEVVDEVAGGDDDVQFAGRVQPVGERDEPPELVVHVAHPGRRFGQPEVTQGRSEGVDPTGNVGVGDVGQPEVGPRRAVVDGMRGDDLPAHRPRPQRDVVEPALGGSADKGEADSVVDRGGRPELEGDDVGGVARRDESDPSGEGGSDQLGALRREPGDQDGDDLGAQDGHRALGAAGFGEVWSAELGEGEQGCEDPARQSHLESVAVQVGGDPYAARRSGLRVGDVERRDGCLGGHG